jgi:hypothetical protein
LKQTVIFTVLLCGLASFIACGNGNNNTSTPPPPSHRALISNLTNFRIDVADTSRDVLVNAVSADTPGRLVLSNDKKLTIALSAVNATVSVIDNTQQGVSGSGSFAGPSQSLIFTVDNALILGAVPGEAAPVGQVPGAVDVITVSTIVNGTSTTSSLTRQPSIFLPGARNLAASPNTNRVVVLSDTVANPANTSGPTGRVWVIQTSLVNSNNQPYQEVVSTLWDHPVSAIVSADNTTAYVLNCGSECGGSQASIVKVDLTPASPNPPVVVGQLVIPSGATVGFVNGNTLYVAGSNPSVVCPSGIPAPCGGLTAVDLGAFSAAPAVAIAGGFHDRVTLGANSLLFVGARGCTIDRTSTPAVGCLTLFDTIKLTATVAPPTAFTPPAPDPGDDVTGMTPISGRNEVYVVQGGELVIYDTTTGKEKVLTNPPNIIGQGVDVIAIDF